MRCSQRLAGTRTRTGVRMGAFSESPLPVRDWPHWTTALHAQPTAPRQSVTEHAKSPLVGGGAPAQRSKVAVNAGPLGNPPGLATRTSAEIGRASCRERV